MQQRRTSGPDPREAPPPRDPTLPRLPERTLPPRVMRNPGMAVGLGPSRPTGGRWLCAFKSVQAHGAERHSIAMGAHGQRFLWRPAWTGARGPGAVRPSILEGGGEWLGRSRVCLKPGRPCPAGATLRAELAGRAPGGVTGPGHAANMVMSVGSHPAACPGWCGSVVTAPACGPEGPSSIPGQGHGRGLRV